MDHTAKLVAARDISDNLFDNVLNTSESMLADIFWAELKGKNKNDAFIHQLVEGMRAMFLTSIWDKLKLVPLAPGVEEIALDLENKSYKRLKTLLSQWDAFRPSQERQLSMTEMLRPKRI